jgi:hypothetical protein
MSKTGRFKRLNFLVIYWFKNLTVDFGGIHISLETSRKRAEEFIKELKNQYIAKHLVAGNSLES